MFKSGQGELSKPQGLTCSPQGVLFVADGGNSRFQAFNHQALFQFSGGEKGSGPGQIKNPTGIAWDKDRVYVADAGNKKVVTFNTSGRYLRENGDRWDRIRWKNRGRSPSTVKETFVSWMPPTGESWPMTPRGCIPGRLRNSLGKSPRVASTNPAISRSTTTAICMLLKKGRIQAYPRGVSCCWAGEPANLLGGPG